MNRIRFDQSLLVRIRRRIAAIILRALGYKSYLQCVRMIEHLEVMNTYKCMLATIKYLGRDFQFDAMSLSKSQLDMLFYEINDLDNYLIQQLPKNNAIIIDVGTHIGILPFVAQHYLNNSTIHCIEPDPANYELSLLNNPPINNNHVFFHQHAISTENSTVEFFRSTVVDWRSTMLTNKEFLQSSHVSREEYATCYIVPAKTLIDTIQSLHVTHIDLMKITIAGNIEMPILQQSITTLAALHTKILAVYVYNQNITDIDRLVAQYQYSLHKIVRSNIRVYILQQ